MRRLTAWCLWLVVCVPWLASCGGKGKHVDEDAGDVVEEAIDTVEEVLDTVEDTIFDVGDSTDCPEGQAFNPYLTPPRCVDCTRACNLEGETDEHWEITAVSGECVCTTEEGYYFSLSGAGVSHRCDRDQDGWVTRSARSNIESADPAIAANARCDPRVVDRVVLLEEGEVVTGGCSILLSDTDLGVDTLALYEADNRDDQVLLDEDIYAPAYGTRKPRAEELNSLTKACVSLIGDYNSSGDADVNEWDLFNDPINAFSYFIELHRGWYEEGAYYIQEKSRLADAPEGWGIPLVYNDDAYWRQCVRMTDSAFDPLGPNAIGMDFARYNDGSGCDAGMHHHSQYKCVHLVEANADPGQYPQRLPMAELDAVPRRYVLNVCEKQETIAGPVVGTVNPSDAILSCEIDTTPSIDDVGFVSVKYLHYDADGDYLRGCVNGCIDDPPTCPLGASCEPDINNYGMPECVCPNHWAGTNCDVCPPYWDAADDCNSCLYNFDPATDCTACLAHYDIASDCTICHPRWQISTGCTTCINNYDVTTDCNTCIYHFDLATLCTECELHFDPFTLCSTCLWNWDVSTDCTTCLNAFSMMTDCRRTGNLLANPGAESGSIAGWTPSGVAMTASTTAPHGGSYRFQCTIAGNSECQLRQELNVEDYEDGINAGRYSLEVDSWMMGLTGDSGFWVEFQDFTGAPLFSSTQRETTSDTWARVTDSIAIPAQTRYIILVIDTDDGGFQTNCAFDDLALYIVE